MPGIGGHAPEAVAAAPLQRDGHRWGVVVCWGLREPDDAVARLSALLALAGPTVGSTLERMRLVERSQEEAALRRIATAVACGRDQPALNAMIAEEVANLLDAESGSVILIEPDGRARLGAAYARPRRAARSEDAVSRVLRSERPARSEGSSFATGWIAGEHGIAAPIRVHGLVRGVVSVERNEGGPFPTSTEDRLVPFAELASIAIQNAERSEALSAEARADELTGVGNRRAFTERMAEEVERARRYGHPLSLVLMDLDRFKAVNDTFGHQVGDEVLVEATRRLSRLVRTGELVARIGGDEIAWLLPETDAEGALRAAERALEAISQTPFETAGAISASAGVSDLAAARSPSELVRLADEALLTAKHDGPGVVRRVM
jgi:diguanylate cyclase (GGDEF)-like protein